MFCQKCGKINPDNEEKCSGCGATLEKAQAPAAPKKRKVWKILLAAVLLVIAVLVVVFLFSGCGAGNVNPNEKVLF